MKKIYANLILFIVTIVWGGGFLATNSALDSFSPFYTLMIRFLGASILPLLISWKKLRQMNKNDIFQGCLAGVFLFFAFAFQTYGLKYSTPSKNAFLTATNVVFVPYLIWLLRKEKPTKKQMIASVSCVAGIACLTLEPSNLTLNIGDILSLLCAVFFALHIIKLSNLAYMDAIALTSLQMISAGSLGAVCALLFDDAPKAVSSQALTGILYSIFIATLLAYLLQTIGQKYTSPNSASMILSLEAFFASLFSYIFLDEKFTFLMIVGAILIFLSIIYIEFKPKGSKNDKIV